jgi:hypothetical protein
MAQVEGSGTAATPKEKLSIVGYGPWSRQILDRKGGKWNRRYCAKEPKEQRSGRAGIDGKCLATHYDRKCIGASRQLCIIKSNGGIC